MARGHLFLIVVLLVGAAVAGLLAVTRTAQSAPVATNDAAITFRMKKLDRLEASLERQLARRNGAAAPSAPLLVYRRAPAAVVGSGQHESHDDEHGSASGDERDD